MTRSLSFMLATIALLATSPAIAKRARWSGKVVGVADGDTITVLHDRHPVRIRLHRIDCPEKAQPFGQRAKRFTAKLVFGKIVSVEVVTIGRYGRTVANVSIGDRSLNEELVKAGLAWWYRRYSPKAKVVAYLQHEARKAKRGLWADANPRAPWLWRRSRRKPGKQRRAPCATTADCIVIDCCCRWHVMRRGDIVPPYCQRACRCRRHGSKPTAACRAGKCVPIRAGTIVAGKLHGNVRSRVFHAPGCRHYDCKNCSAAFTTRQAAIKAGYRPHRRCVGRAAKP